ncbi:autotransporter outer membrane beta-barrel domain-containing protein [Chelativorans salis]|uniref:Autotransporter outer membrane beta-barrel domain-containing protein n=1 Tax=Chelativorans salis TaxID=2978478 RepID=A0ABT2LUB5_9HYPH|nr:autotransporter outer membrane beta-barrel domain-containing protein [Chelativorans sp. EGI FJ00035]MCT7377442.1 autotransporter outer membrane beta-barrel domain-containing protein [Chelativorans sp. EGI FJ00035]
MVATFALAAGAPPAATEDGTAIGLSDTLAALSRQRGKSVKSANRQLELVRDRLANTRGPRLNGRNINASSLAMRFAGGSKKDSAAFETKHLLAPKKERRTRHRAAWLGGDVMLDSARAENPRLAALYTNGLTFGADARLSSRLLVGNAVGAAFDRTPFGADGSLGTYYLSNTLYGSLTTSTETFLDVALGASRSEFSGDYGAAGGSASGRRSANQFYGQARYSHRFERNRVRVRSYGQAKLLHTRLGDYVENGDGAHLGQAQSMGSLELTFGVRGETSVMSSVGKLTPHAVLEMSRTARRASSAVVTSLDEATDDNHVIASSSAQSGRLTARTGLNWAISDDATFKGEYSVSSGMAEFRPRQKVTARFKLKF